MQHLAGFSRSPGAGHRLEGRSECTVPLTGQGDRRQALTPEVGIATHVTDLTELLWFEDLRDVDLVLHSYAGVLAWPVAERAAWRLASVTYLAAFIVRPGQCLPDVEPPMSRGGTESWPHQVCRLARVGLAVVPGAMGDH